MGLSIRERIEIDDLKKDVEALKKGTVPDLTYIQSALADLSARLTKIEQRSKPGPKPKVKP